MITEVCTGYEPHQYQAEISENLAKHRFAVLVCHRRFGKTVLAVNTLVDAALRCTKPNGRYQYVAPFLRQAKQISWHYLLSATMGVPGTRKNESELYVELPNGARVTLYGADNAEAMRGIYSDGIVLDEYANYKSHIFGEIIRPLISDRKGFILIIGTPRGIDEFYEMYVHALNDPAWYGGMYRADETDLPWLDDEELEAARSMMSDNQYRQEFLTDFTASSDDVIMPIDLVSDSMKRVIPNTGYLQGMEKVIGIDPAWYGGDSVAVACRWGLQVFDPIKLFHQEDHDQIVGYVMNQQLVPNPDAIVIDVAYGQYLIKRFHNLGVEVIEVNFGSNAMDEVQYKDRVTEMYFRHGEWLAAGGVLPEDIELKAELCARTYRFNPRSQREINKKDKVREMLGRSPDKADAVVLTTAIDVIPRAAQVHSQTVKVSRGDYHPHNKIARKGL